MLHICIFRRVQIQTHYLLLTWWLFWICWIQSFQNVSWQLSHWKSQVTCQSSQSWQQWSVCWHPYTPGPCCSLPRWGKRWDGWMKDHKECFVEYDRFDIYFFFDIVTNSEMIIINPRLWKRYSLTFRQKSDMLPVCVNSPILVPTLTGKPPGHGCGYSPGQSAPWKSGHLTGQWLHNGYF